MMFCFVVCFRVLSISVLFYGFSFQMLLGDLETGRCTGIANVKLFV